jgi:hypothetical protein
LRDRIAALQEMARPLMPADGAGADLLGAAWPGAVEAFNAQWRHGAEWLWAFEHQRFKRVVAPLLQTENAESDLPLAQRLTRATALRALAPADGLAELSRLRKQCPDDPAVTFAYGIALLDDGDPEGASLLEALAIGRPTYRSPAYARLATYFGRIDEELSDRWSERLRGASLRRASATWSFMAAVEDGHGHPSALPPAALGVLLDAIARDSCVERAWLFQGRAALATAENAHAADLELHALIMTLDPEMLSRVGADQDTQGQRYTEVLAALVPADAETPVRSYFTTQPIPAGLHAQPPLFDRRTLRTG